ncbi:hypothetical protein ABK040_001906 [Willaertia magna]
MEPFHSIDILSEIIKYLDDILDYINFAQTNKYIYEILLLQNSEYIIVNEHLNYLFKKSNLSLNIELPNYLFKIKYLNVEKDNNNNFNLLNNFKNLTSLTINKLPEDFILIDLPKLENLNITNTFVQNNTFLNLQQLKTLKLKDSYFPQCCFDGLKNLIELKIINFKNTKEEISNRICFKNLLNLQKLYVNTNNTFIYNLGEATKLKELTLLNVFVDCLFLQKLINLEKLKIGVNFKHEDILNLTKLRKLKIPKNKYVNTNFIKLISLEELECSDVVNVNDVKNIKKLKLIQIRYIGDNYLTQFNGINFVKIGLYYCDIFFEKTFVILKNLKKLKLCKCDILNEDYFSYLNNLKSLKIKNCDKITGKCLLFLNQLQKLHIKKSNIKDEYLLNLKKLKKLNIFGCHNITGDCLLNLNLLKELNISNTNVKDEHLINLNNLKILYAINCSNLKGTFLLKLKKLKEFYFEEEFDDYGCKIDFNLTIKDIKQLIKKGNTLGMIIENIYNEQCTFTTLF